MRRLPVSAWLWFAFLVVAALPLLGLALTYQSAFERSLVEALSTNIATIARKKAHEVETYVRERIDDAADLAQRPSIKGTLTTHRAAPGRDGIPAREKAVLERELGEFARRAGYYDLLLIDSRGVVIFSLAQETDLGTSLVEGPYRDTGLGRAYRANSGGSEPRFTGFQPYAPSNGQSAAFVVAPVRNGKAVVGALALQLDRARVAEVAADKTGLMSSGETVLGQQDGDRVRYMSGLNWANAAPGSEMPLQEAAWPMRQALEGKVGQGRVLDYSGRDCLAAWRYLPSLGWGMTVKIDAAEALQPAARLRTLACAVFAGFLLLAAMAAHLLGSAVSRPLRKLTASAERIASGKLEERVEDARLLGELATLASAFNQMADSVEASQRRLENTVQQRTEELAETTTQLENDIAMREWAEEKLRLYGEVFKQGADAILLTDQENRIVDANPAFEALTGYPLEDVKGRDPNVLASGKTPREVYENLWASLGAKGYWVGEIWDKRKDGSVYPKLMSASVVRDGSGAVTNYIARFSDISERKAIEARMEQLAHYDGLTGLPNRFNLQQELEHAVSEAAAGGYKIAVAFIDLDRFKAINDTLGHAVGDELLMRVGQRLRNCVRESDIVARFGGDEYVLVLPSRDNRDAAVRVAEKVMKHLREPYQIRGHRVHSTPSMGIALYPEDGSTAEEVMRSADTAMYLAKSQGRNNAQFFTPELTRSSLDRMHLERELRTAMEGNQLLLHYQPKLDLRTGVITGVEALLRWPHASLGFIAPSRFVPIAEDAGLIPELTEWVLEKACRRLRSWKELGLDCISVAVNLSAHSLRSHHIVAQVAATLEKHGLPPHELELEVTESAAMADQGRCIEQLKALRDLGVKLAIDDFGTGYSSLSYLRLLPVDTLKLDRSFVENIDSDPAGLAICDATISLAHKLGLQVVAEGVESAAQHDLLFHHGCDTLQGYFICKPLSEEQALVFIREWNRDKGCGCGQPSQDRREKSE